MRWSALYRSIVPTGPEHYVRGQYDGYLKIDGVADRSTTETFAALRLEIDHWRWSGVPFFIRTGKRLPATQTEVRLVFNDRRDSGSASPTPSRNPTPIVIRLDPETGIRFNLERRHPDTRTARPIMLDMEFKDQGGESYFPYEVLLLHGHERAEAVPLARGDAVK